MRSILCMLVILFGLTYSATSVAVSVEDVTNPRRHGEWVTDLADMIDPATEAELNTLIGQAEAVFGVEIAVVTVDAVDTATPKDFATELFNHWGIGKADSDNGLLVLMVQSSRRLEMEIGYGMESVLTDGWLKAMQEAEMVPRFKRGDFGDGVYEGVRLSIQRIRRQSAGFVSDRAYTPSLVSRVQSVPWWVWLVFGVGGVGTGVTVYKRRRDRTCTNCNSRMTMLPEDEEVDVHLDPGQQTEKAIGSVDWQYWCCERCGQSRLLRVGKWFSGYSNCSSCGNKTVSTSEETITPATYHSSGLARKTEACAHCSHQRTWTKTLPQLQQSSSSAGGSGGGGSFSGGSAGGGGSFSGGSSGGGGAGSGW